MHFRGKQKVRRAEKNDCASPSSQIPRLGTLLLRAARFLHRGFGAVVRIAQAELTLDSYASV